MSKSTNSDNNLIFKSRETLLQQLKIQGYNTSEYENFTPNQVHILNQNKQLDMLLENGDVKVYIKYYITKSLRPNNIYDIIDELYKNDEVSTLSENDNLIVIVREEPNDTLINLLKHIWENEKINIILYNIKRLQFNVLNHVYNPKIRKMTNNENDELLKKYYITDLSQIPEISRFDPVSMALGLKPGDICEIIRPSKTAISGIYYRLCKNI